MPDDVFKKLPKFGEINFETIIFTIIQLLLHTYFRFIRIRNRLILHRLFRKRLTLLRATGEAGFSSLRFAASDSASILARGVMRSVIGVVARLFWRSLPFSGKSGPRVRKLDLGVGNNKHSFAGQPGRVS